MPLVVIINPVSGPKSAPAFFKEHVFPLLTSEYHAVETTSKDHAAEILQGTDPVTVILGSGDGTLHDIINAVKRPINFVLVPCGTANALYASLFPPKAAGEENSVEYKLQSLRAFLANSTTPIPLSIASTTLASSTTPYLSTVVVSTSLHASILHHSEALRAAHPGIERFKIAAQQNSTKWYKARLVLRPASTQSAVQIYDPQSQSFIDHPLSTSDHPTITLEGPYAYFLSTVNVDRLEPAFRIAPLARSIPPPPSTTDIVLLRPLRDPTVEFDSPQAREAFVSKLWAVLGAAYQDGAHINLAYAPDGQLLPVPGPTVIEHIRCGSFDWTPDSDDTDAHLICIDGATSHIPTGSIAQCTIDASPHAFTVYS